MGLNTNKSEQDQENKEFSKTANTTDVSKTSEIQDIKVEEKDPVKYDPYASQLEGIKFPYYAHKQVIIKRRASLAVLPGLDPDDTREKIGSSFKGSAVNRGLTKQEERRWLAPMLGLDLRASEWEAGTKDYWANISEEVPPNGKNDLGGLKLEVGLFYEDSHESNEEGKTVLVTAKSKYIADLKASCDTNGVIINPSGEPINLANYILWRYCLVYVDVANDITLVNMSPKIRFYMFTKEKQIQDKKVLLDKKRKATQLYNSSIGDRNWVDHMLYSLIPGDKDSNVMLKDISSMSPDEKDVLLYDYLDRDVSRFISIGSDRNLEMRSLIELSVAVGRLHKIPNTTTYVYEGETIGNTEEEVVAYLSNPRFSNVLRTLKAQVNVTPSN